MRIEGTQRHRKRDVTLPMASIHQVPKARDLSYSIIYLQFPSLLPPEKVEMGYQQSQRTSAAFLHLLMLRLGVTCAPLALGEQPFPNPNPGGLFLVLKPPNFLTPQKNLQLLCTRLVQFLDATCCWLGRFFTLLLPFPLHFHQKEVLLPPQTECMAPRSPA